MYVVKKQINNFHRHILYLFSTSLTILLQRPSLKCKIHTCMSKKTKFQIKTHTCTQKCK